MLQRFRSLVDDVIEVTRVQGTAVATTIDEVKRVLTKGDGAEPYPGTPSQGNAAAADDRRDGTFDSSATSSTASRGGGGGGADDDKNLLKDFLDLRNFTLSARPAADGSGGATSTTTVKVRQISSRKYKDSESSEDEDERGSSVISGGGGGGAASVAPEPPPFRKTDDSCQSSPYSSDSSILSGVDDEACPSETGETRAEENSDAEESAGRDRDRDGPAGIDREKQEEYGFALVVPNSGRRQDRSGTWGGSDAPQRGPTTAVVSRRKGSPGSSERGTPFAERRGPEDGLRQGGTKADFAFVQVHRPPKNRQTDSLIAARAEADCHHATTTETITTTTTNDKQQQQQQRQEKGIENHDGDHDELVVDGRGSWSSAASSSMPSIAITVTATCSEKNSASAGFEEECEDIGEVFAAYGARKAASQTNLSKLSPFTKKRMGLRVSSRESIVSCYSNAGEENCCQFPVTGEILFGLSYNYRQSVLEVHIKECKGLASVDQKRNSSDPYVKTYLLPDRTKNGKRKTRIKKRCLNPVFDEVLKYHVTKSELETRTLSLAVLHNDRFGRNDFLGEVVVHLDYYSFDNPTPTWHKLRDRPNGPYDEDGNLSPLLLTYKGDLNLCLKFISSEYMSGKARGFEQKGELHVIVKEARNLTAVRTNGYSDPFCKGYLLPDRSHEAKRKSPVVRRNCNPKWNWSVVFENVSWEELQERSLELTVWDHDRLTTNDFLGGVRLNLGSGKSQGRDVTWMDSKPDEASLWQAVLDRPNCWIEGTLLLRLHMNQRK